MAGVRGGEVVSQSDRANGMCFMEAGTVVILRGVDGDKKPVNEAKPD